MYELGTARVSVVIDDTEALRQIQKTASSIQSTLKNAFSNIDYFKEINKSLDDIAKRKIDLKIDTSSAATRERSMSGGRNPKLVMINHDELIINAQTTAKLGQMLTGNRIPNYARGSSGMAAKLAANPPTRFGGDIKIDMGGITIQGTNSTEQDAANFARIAEAKIVDVLLKQKKPGGLLS